MTKALSLGRVGRKEGKRFGKFLVVGGLGFVVDFGVFNLAHALGFGLWAATWLRPPASQSLAAYATEHPEVIEQSLSFALAVLSNFCWNYFWIYPEARSANQANKMLKFVVVSVAGLMLGVPIFSLALYFSKALVTIAGLDHVGLNLAGNMALICRVGALLFWNFFVNRFWTYRDVA